jgi:spoIIIJ-associated protein
MESFEISGKTVEEAVQRAAEKLGVSRDEVKYKVLKEGKSGILGIGAEDAKILVEPVASPEDEIDVAALAKSILEDLLRQMSFKVMVVVGKPLVDESTEAAPMVTFNVTGDDDIGILIGRHGQTISSLQYLLRVIVSNRVKSPPSIIVDIDGYKQRRYAALRATAKRLAEQVKTRKSPFTLEPMPAFERRIIHLALANDPDVTTQSIGEGDGRKVVIMPQNMNKGTRTGRSNNNRR